MATDKKTQEIAAMRADLDAQRADLIRQKELLTTGAFRENVDAKANSTEEYDIVHVEKLSISKY